MDWRCSRLLECEGIGSRVRVRGDGEDAMGDGGGRTLRRTGGGDHPRASQRTPQGATIRVAARLAGLFEVRLEHCERDAVPMEGHRVESGQAEAAGQEDEGEKASLQPLECTAPHGSNNKGAIARGNARWVTAGQFGLADRLFLRYIQCIYIGRRPSEGTDLQMG